MSQELTQVVCPECGSSGGSADPAASRWQCTACGNGFYLRRCSACALVSYVDGLQGFRSPWPCVRCGESNTGFSQNHDPASATVAELAAELARYGLAAAAAGPAAEGQAGPAQIVDSGAGAGRQDPGDLKQPPAPRAARRRTRRSALWAAAIAACATVSLLLVAEGPGTTGSAAGLVRRGNATRAVQVTAGHVGAIDIQGVPGQLSIVGTGTGQVTLTGQLHWSGSAPVVQTRRDPADGVLTVTIRCAPASSCTQNLRLVVPAATGTRVRQPGGRVVLTGLAGQLRITAANADISAAGLRSPEFVASIASGHLSAIFTAPPRQVRVTLSAAQATLRLPPDVAYRVSKRVTSGHINVAIPQSGSAARHVVIARIHSGELELLPA